jgi:hypothetical protein
MIENTPFPPLTNFEPTRETLHWYAKAVGVLPRVHAEAHPKWWHISLKLRPDGLYTEPMGLPSGGSLRVKMDLTQHKVVFLVDDEEKVEFSLIDGLTATAFGDQILAAAAELGLSGSYERYRFENEDLRRYDADTVPAFWQALVNSHNIFEEFRSSLSGEVSPLQFWTHGFDLAFEWFGPRMVVSEENGQRSEYPSQINLGFYPGNPVDAPYFYSNPWPFEADFLLDRPLPSGASWYIEGWQGTIFPYDELVGDANAEERLREYARVVHELASPTLQSSFVAARPVG